MKDVDDSKNEEPARRFMRVGPKHARKVEAIATLLRELDSDEGCEACATNDDGFCGACVEVRVALREVVMRMLARLARSLAGKDGEFDPVFDSDFTTVLGFVPKTGKKRSASRVAGRECVGSYRLTKWCWIARPIDGTKP